MTERSQWTEYKMNNQIYKQRTAEHNRLRQTVMREHSVHVHAHTAQERGKIMPNIGVFVQHSGEEVQSER